MLTVLHGYSLNLITFVTEETVNGDNIAEQNNVMLHSEKIRYTKLIK